MVQKKGNKSLHQATKFSDSPSPKGRCDTRSPASHGTSTGPNPSEEVTTPKGSSSSTITSSHGGDDAIKVVVRVRPLNEREQNSRCFSEAEIVSIPDSNSTISVMDPSKGTESCRISVDRALATDTSQEEVFAEVGSSMVDHCMAGFNSSIFAYGQTGSGKTHTMLGSTDRRPDGSLEASCGLAPRVFDALFTAIAQHEQASNERRRKGAQTTVRYSVRCSFLEIYNEEVTDLLRPTASGLQIRDGDLKRGVYVQGLSETEVLNADDVLELISIGSEHRRQASTLMNERSSRSHSVFTATIEARERTPSGTINARFSKLNLIDLAGSERVGKSKATGEQLSEARSINRSLTVLGRVIAALGERQKRPNLHVPYRDSRLTFLLRESLGGNSRTCIVTTITPAADSFQETCSTLAFASGAKKVRCRAIVNEDCIGDAKSLQQETLRLQKVIEELERRPSEWEVSDLRQKLEQAEALFDQNNAAITSLRAESEFVRRELTLSKHAAQRLAEEASQLRSDNLVLQRSVQTTESEKQELLKEVEVARETVDRLKMEERSELIELRHAVQDARRDAARMTEEAAEAKAGRTAAETSLEEVRGEVRRLQREAKEESIAAAAREQDLRREAEHALRRNKELQTEIHELRRQLEHETASVWKYRRMVKEISRLVDWAQMGSRPQSSLTIDTDVGDDKENVVMSQEPSPAAQSALHAARMNLTRSKTFQSGVARFCSVVSPHGIANATEEGSPVSSVLHDLLSCQSSADTTIS